MTIELWWPRLSVETRRWLVANNGDSLTAPLRAKIEAAGGPAVSDEWWSEQEGSPGPCMPDEVTDWIEELAHLGGALTEEFERGQPRPHVLC